MTSLLTQDRLDVLAESARLTCDLAGEMAEYGVYRGGSAKVIAEACQKKLHLFDNFSGGIPEDDQHGIHRKGDFATNLDEVKAYLDKLNVEYHVGVFPETAKGLEDLRFSFVHIDADTIQSTRAGILFFYPRLVEHGICVFDDYGFANCPGVERAIAELLPFCHLERTAWIQARVTKRSMCR